MARKPMDYRGFTAFGARHSTSHPDGVHSPIGRRAVLKTGAVLSAAGLVGAWPSVATALSRLAASQQLPMLRKRVPSTGEMIPCIGVGTNRFRIGTADEMSALGAVLRALADSGARVVDTANSYGTSEEAIGQLVGSLGVRSALFLSTKVSASQGDASRGLEQLEESFRNLRSTMVDLVQVHNLGGSDVMFPVLREWKQEGRIRYYGVTTSRDTQYAALEALMRQEPIDFVQVDYSISNRNAAERLLPAAADRGVAVLINVPFNGGGGGNLIEQMTGRKLPEWAAEFDAHSWAQFFLKYIVSHPAVTCAIPGTTKVEHLLDNLGAARGRLPDAAMRARMESFVAASR